MLSFGALLQRNDHLPILAFFFVLLFQGALETRRWRGRVRWHCSFPAFYCAISFYFLRGIKGESGPFEEQVGEGSLELWRAGWERLRIRCCHAGQGSFIQCLWSGEMQVTISCYRSPSAATRHHQLLQATISCYSSPSAVTTHHQLLQVVIRFC